VRSFIIFCAQYLIAIAGVAALGVVVYRLRGASRRRIVSYVLMVVLIFGVSFVVARIASAVYHHPRPFVVEHKKPYISHPADNGFPSDHALLAAAFVAAVALVDVWLAVPFVVLAGLVDWGRVASRLHHVTDVVASTVIVAVVTLVVVAVAAAGDARGWWRTRDELDPAERS
jgi:undecaprenyl-diphosphatase